MYLYQVICVLLIVLTAVIGDHLLVTISGRVLKAISDNVTHALIGYFACQIVLSNCSLHHKYHIFQTEAILCMMIASFIDLDHFFTARSIFLKDAITLNRRPIFHSSTVPLLLSLVLFALSYIKCSTIIQKIGIVIFIAFGTHHTRDAYRRGYWFHPFGSTPPLNYYLYLGITILLPYLTSVCIQFCKCLKEETYEPVKLMEV